MTPARNSDEAVRKLQAFMLWRDHDGLEVLEDAAPEEKLMFSVMRNFANMFSLTVPLSVPSCHVSQVYIS